MNHATGTFLVLGGLVVAWFGAFGRGHWAEISAQRSCMNAAYERHARAELETEQATLLERCEAELAAWRAQLAPHLRAPEIPELMLTTTNGMQADGLSLEASVHLSPDPALGPNQRVRIAVTGTFANLFRALTKLENTMPPTRVTELTVTASADGASVRGEMVVVQTWQEGG